PTTEATELVAVHQARYMLIAPYSRGRAAPSPPRLPQLSETPRTVESWIFDRPACAGCFGGPGGYWPPGPPSSYSQARERGRPAPRTRRPGYRKPTGSWPWTASASTPRTSPPAQAAPAVPP